jgi:UDP-N-acetylglucosamine--dolichyl-phosphate N-acetylglucosaminephosphotransferase
MEQLMFLGFLFFPVLMISFIITFLIMPKWIRRAHTEEIMGKDIHKLDKRKVAEGGGLIVMIGFILGVFLYIAIKTFVFKEERNVIQIFGLLTVLFFASAIGIMDDFLGWKKGLSKRVRLILLIFCAIPLMVLNIGESTMFGINWGVLFPLIIVPIAIIGATSTFNFLAGYNGLEASQGILILTAMAIATFVTGNPWLSLICACMVASLIAFYLFNMYPARVFPGDILTYSVGALIACVAILGNIEKIALFFFIPYILEVLLKLRGGLKKESFAKLNKYGGLEEPYDKIYGLEHLALRILKNFKNGKKINEWEVTLLINSFQILIIALAFLIFL